MSVFDSELADKIEKTGVVAVLTIDEAENAVPLAKALLDGGVDIMELTLRTDAALDALKKIKAEVSDMVAGVGTVLKPDQVKVI